MQKNNLPAAKSVTPSATPNDLLILAIQNNADIDKLEKLMQLQERWEARQAKKAYIAAMAKFKSNPPKIIKDMHVEYTTSKGKVKYDHASLGNIVAAITEALSKVDISINWQINQGDGVQVTCTATHVDGHSESTTISAAPDDSGGKNPIQAIGSTITYLQRYTLLAICGLATNEFEDDGRKAAAKREKRDIQYISKEDFDRLSKKIAEKKNHVPSEILDSWRNHMKTGKVTIELHGEILNYLAQINDIVQEPIIHENAKPALFPSDAELNKLQNEEKRFYNDMQFMYKRIEGLSGSTKDFIDILNGFGCSAVSELTPEERPKFYYKLRSKITELSKLKMGGQNG